MKDYTLELGCLGFTMRMKRLSDGLIHDGRKMYKSMGLDIEPNWYVIFRLLKKSHEMSVTEIAAAIRLAHPSVISITNKMIKAGYLSSAICTEDSRRRVIQLTEKALNKLEEFDKIWDAGERGIIKALQGTNSLSDLQILEERFSEKGFMQRTLDELNNHSAKNTTNTKTEGIMNLNSTNLDSVTFTSFHEEYATDFARLNYEWLEKYFEVETHDREMLDNPKEYIIDQGGQIYFAKYNNEIVGTVALIVEDDNTLELAKMGVTSKYQGFKIGRKLINHALSEARRGDKKQVVLESNTKLTAALNLYISYGFKVAPLSECSPYTRCNIRMIYHL